MKRCVELPMIEFDCPKCGELLEVKDRMAGEKVRCVECDRLVRVPDEDDDDDDDYDRPRRRRLTRPDEGLSALELVLFGLLCLCVPGVNVLVTSILYYVWRSSQPKRANQINMLGFAIFGVHAVCLCIFFIATAASRPR